MVKELLVDQSDKARPELDALAYAYIFLQVAIAVVHPIASERDGSTGCSCAPTIIAVAHLVCRLCKFLHLVFGGCLFS